MADDCPPVTTDRRQSWPGDDATPLVILTINTTHTQEEISNMSRIVLGHLWKRADGLPGLAGRLGHLRLQVIPIEGAGPDEPCFAIMLSETKDTVQPGEFRGAVRSSECRSTVPAGDFRSAGR
jgi:hypothetical protein